MNKPPRVSPLYSPSEQSAVKLWRQQVGDRVERRITLYRTQNPRKKPRRMESLRCQRTEHNVFRVPELLDMILQFVGPKAQIQAMLISTSWRTSAISVISSATNLDAFRSLQPCAPTEYGQIIDWEGEDHPLRPNNDEVTQFGRHVARVFDKQSKSRIGKTLYFPAYLAQSPDLPDAIAHSLNELDVRQRDYDRTKVLSVSRNADLYWLDFSQFRISLYFELLFSEEGHFKHRLGRWEISLRAAATSNTLLIDDSDSNTLLLPSITSMQLVHPPCKSVGIYHPDLTPLLGSRWGAHVLTRRLRREDGIRIGDVLEALQDAAPALLSSWIQYAEQLRERIKDAHWIDDIWKLSGTPRFRIHLDSTDMQDERPPDKGTHPAWEDRRGRAIEAQLGCPVHITRRAYMFSEPFRATREGEWISEELFEPMKSETERGPINWNT